MPRCSLTVTVAIYFHSVALLSTASYGTGNFQKLHIILYLCVNINNMINEIIYTLI